MGLSNGNSSNGKFVTIVNGKWTLRVPEGTDGASPRVLEKGPNTGTTVWEKYYDHIDGALVSAHIKHGQFGADLCLNISDDAEYTVQIPVDSQYFSVFGKVAPNLDPTASIFLGLGYDKEKGRTFMYVKQDGQTVHSAFTKDNPNGMPPPEQKMVKGVKKWDFEDQENFLYSKVEDFIALLGGEAPPAPAEEEDDVPF